MLSGSEFDRAYITTLLFEHAKEMKVLEQHALIEKNQEVRQWAAGAVPVVEEHMPGPKSSHPFSVFLPRSPTDNVPYPELIMQFSLDPPLHTAS